jgi:hypothetical protein
VTDDPRTPEPDGPPPDLVDRGPVETLAPSRTAVVLVAVAALAVAILAGLGALDVEGGRSLDDEEELLAAGRHELTAGPVTLDAELPGDWVARRRCDRWVQLAAADDDATTLHLVWLDAVPRPSDADEVTLVPAPGDLPTWWRDKLDLEVTAVPAGGDLDGRPVERYVLGTTDDARRRDGLVACGEVGNLAATGMFGPAARFEQEVALVDVDGTPVMLVAAAYLGGDVERATGALDHVLETGRLQAAGG